MYEIIIQKYVSVADKTLILNNKFSKIGFALNIMTTISRYPITDPVNRATIGLPFFLFVTEK